MTTEQELKERCTPEFIKWMCEIAEGFHISERYIYPLVKSTCINYNGWCAETTENFVDTVFSFALFPLLIHRAVEGWNKKAFGKDCIVISDDNLVFWSDNLDLCRVYDFKNYQPDPDPNSVAPRDYMNFKPVMPY